MDQALLVIEQTEGGQKLIDQLQADGVPITLAYWAREDDDARWYLHLVTPEADRVGTLEVYPRVRQAIARCSWDNRREAIDPESVRVLWTTDRRAKEIRERVDRYPGPQFNIWADTVWTGGAASSGLFVYAHPAQLTSTTP